MRVFLLSISLLISIAATAWASCTSASKDSSCHFEWDASKRFPEEAKRLGRGAAVYICTGKNARVLLASPIKRHPTGVCSFWWQNMDAKEGTSQEDMRQQVMQISSGACPRQSDPSYIDSTKVSEEMFGEIMRKWDAAGSSDKGRFAFPPQTASDRQFGVVDFAEVLRAPEGHKRIVVTGLQTAGARGADVEPSYHAPHDFDVFVRDNENPSMLYSLAVSRENGELKIVHVDALMLGC